MTGIICPNCNTETYDPKYSIDEFYVCASCGKPLGYFCRRCDRVYTGNRLGLHGDVYECKLCGTIQWGYTEWKRDQSNKE